MERVAFGLLLLSILAAGARADVFHWLDGDGTDHFSDRPPSDRAEEAERLSGPEPGFSADASRPETPPERLHVVARVIDGDTLELADGTRVRLIGIDAPETASRNRPAEAGGYRAFRALAERLEGKKVRLREGVERRDRYGRLLSHVVDSHGGNVGVWLLREGLARAAFYPPNDRLAAVYFAAEREAREQRRGIWRLPGHAVHPAAEAAGYRNSFRRLRGRITAIASGPSGRQLVLDRVFSARVDPPAAEVFEQTFGAALRPGRTVVVRGKVRQGKQGPFMVLRHPLQLRIE